MIRSYWLVIVILTTVVKSSNSINPYPRFAKYSDSGDPGEPLFLTPLIRNGSITQAQKAARVTGKPLHSVESYAGYLTVNEQYNSNLFFWYFPSQSDPDNDPIILWLQGGPGSTSLFGLFTENGPFIVTDTGLEHRKYSWHINHHLIFIDNPVGTGYSFTEHDAGYARNERDVGQNLYEAVQQLFVLFPKFQTLKFYVAGESYGGKYVPALAYKIHKEHRGANRIPINLTGIAIGNGLSDPLHQLQYSDYLYQLGLIDMKTRKFFHEIEEKTASLIKSHDMLAAFEMFDQFFNIERRPGTSLFHNYTGLDNFYNYLRPETDPAKDRMGQFVQMSKTRRSIHVGNMTFHDRVDLKNLVEEYLKEDIMDSVAPWLAELLNNYRVCIYNGQLDIIVAYPLTLAYLQKLKFNDAEAYRNAPRYIWRIDGEIAGYAKEAGNLVEVLVRNAGHMAPADQPKWVYDMITRLTNGTGFAK